MPPGAALLWGAIVTTRLPRLRISFRVPTKLRRNQLGLVAYLLACRLNLFDYASKAAKVSPVARQGKPESCNSFARSQSLASLPGPALGS